MGTGLSSRGVGSGVCTLNLCCQRQRVRIRSVCSCTLGDERQYGLPVAPLPLVSGKRGSGDCTVVFRLVDSIRS